MAQDPDANAQAPLLAWLAEATNHPGPFELERLTGGASPRRFSRVTLPGSRRAVLMEVPPDTPDRIFASERGRPWPFLEVRALLASAGVRVPRLFAAACERGLLLVEDLGDTLAEHLDRKPGERERLYRRAVLDLAAAQARLHPLPQGSVVRERAFDRKLLGWELEHFWEWAIVARDLDTSDRAAFERAAAWIVDEILKLPQGFVHRDYQSRNLLVTAPGEPDAALGWIDFQDALLGPRAYDLVALLCDSYQPFDRASVDARLADYASARGLTRDDHFALGREFDLLTLQRKLKDAGRFVFIEKKRGDASFLPFIAPTLDIVRQALARLSEVDELGGLQAIVERALRAGERRAPSETSARAPSA